MTAARLILGVLLVTLALAATACGSGSPSVSEGAVANVNGVDITKAELDRYMEASKRGAERQQQEFPKAGTPEYQTIQRTNVAVLVEVALYRQAAEDLGVKVTEKDIDKLENDTIDEFFDGNRAKYEKALKEHGFTREQYRQNQYAVTVLSTKLFEAVTKDVEVSDQDLLEYYTQNQSQYGTPESREVRHILIAEKDGDGNVDFEASKKKADQVYAQLEDGADFAALAKRLSADPGSKDTGGKLTISRGQTVPEFDQVAFELGKGELSKPVKTTYGYHVIEAVSDVTPAKTTPFNKVKLQLRTQLLQQKRNEVMQKWVEDLKADYKDKIGYAVGYEPSELPEAPTETQ